MQVGNPYCEKSGKQAAQEASLEGEGVGQLGQTGHKEASDDGWLESVVSYLASESMMAR